jgi:hypothetical protein
MLDMHIAAHMYRTSKLSTRQLLLYSIATQSTLAFFRFMQKSDFISATGDGNSPLSLSTSSARAQARVTVAVVARE